MKFCKLLAIPLSYLLMASVHANFYLDQIPRNKDFCWVKHYAEQGDTAAQNDLGIMYAYGIGVNTNLDCAVKWWTKAANLGDAEAQYNLGNAYATGLGVRQDYNKSFIWFKAAAQQSLMVAQTDLAECYAEGKGVHKNIPEAIKWYTRAAAQGDEYALDKLGQYGIKD